MLYELLTGDVPVGRYEPVSRRSRADSRVDAIVDRALEQDPARRYQAARGVREELEHVQGQWPAGSPADPVHSSSRSEWSEAVASLQEVQAALKAGEQALRPAHSTGSPSAGPEHGPPERAPAKKDKGTWIAGLQFGWGCGCLFPLLGFALFVLMNMAVAF